MNGYVISDKRKNDNESTRVFIVEKRNYYKALEDVSTYLNLCKELNLEVIIHVEHMVKLFDPPIPTDDFGVKIKISGDKEKLDDLQSRWQNNILREMVSS